MVATMAAAAVAEIRKAMRERSGSRWSRRAAFVTRGNLLEYQNHPQRIVNV
jgi:hypothetical protein